jgi:3-hydroxyisobutyrate dehydrogenase-like beta-hydroxyacid dehydrogenase
MLGFVGPGNMDGKMATQLLAAGCPVLRAGSEVAARPASDRARARMAARCPCSAQPSGRYFCSASPRLRLARSQ